MYVLDILKKKFHFSRNTFFLSLIKNSFFPSYLEVQGENI